MKTHLTLEFETPEELAAFTARMAGGESSAPSTEATVDANQPDSDGMPYDAAVHANPPSQTEDGRWRAKRGKATEATAARAAFLAKGGTVQPPADVETRAPVMGDAPAPAAPTLPPPMAAPVTLEAVFARINEKLADKSLSGERLIQLYTTHCGSADGAVVGAVLDADESKRAAFMADLA